MGAVTDIMMTINPKRGIAILVALQLFQTLTHGNRYYAFLEDSVRCLAPVPLPVHGTMVFSGKFLMRLTCSDPDQEDVAASAPGKPPGILWCDQNRANRHLANLETPRCMRSSRTRRLPILPEHIAIDFSLVYNSTSANCANNAKMDQLRVQSLAIVNSMTKPAVSAISWPKPIQLGVNLMSEADCWQTGNSYSLKVGYMFFVEYQRTKTNQAYEEYRATIVAAIGAQNQAYEEYTATIVAASGNTAIGSIGYTFSKMVIRPSWRSLCRGTGQIGTVLALHGVARCRGCAEGFYKDPYTGDRCLQCALGYQSAAFSDYMRGTTASCSRCMNSPWAGTTREEWLRICYYRF